MDITASSQWKDLVKVYEEKQDLRLRELFAADANRAENYTFDAAGLPALTRAVKLQNRAARVGFDWPSTDEVFDKLAEEVEELRVEIAAGDKAKAKHIAVKANAPLAPGTKDPVKDADEIVALAQEFGLPIAIKAVYGGGGRGLVQLADDGGGVLAGRGRQNGTADAGDAHQHKQQVAN